MNRCAISGIIFLSRALLGTTLFNAITWITKGAGIPLATAYADAMSSEWYVVLAYATEIFASGMGGYTSAALSLTQPYLNALLAGVVLMTWYLVMYATPVAVIRIDTATMILQVLLPVPMAILGAYIRNRTRAKPENEDA